MITKLTSGMTNTSYVIDDKLVRIAGKNTEQLINRHQESANYKAIWPLDISDELYYIDDTVKISRYINNAKLPDINSESDLRRCIALLHQLHDANIQVEHNFDFRSKFNDYSYLAERTISEDIEQLLKFVESQPHKTCLTHIDAVYTNFLLTDDKDYLIDWEYAANADPDIDLAMFAVYVNFSKEQFDKFIDMYDDVCLERRMKIYAYAALAGLLWSMWCEIKRQFVHTDYYFNQLQYFETYSKIVNDYLNSKVDTAIILAAGCGTRMKNLTKSTAKPLLKVNNEVIIEKQIKKLREAGIMNIYIVVGYLAEQFEYLSADDVHLIYNKHYDTYNNCYSMYLARHVLKHCNNCIILDADIYFSDDFKLQTCITQSSYSYIKSEQQTNEWHIVTLNDKIVDVIRHAPSSGKSLIDISYWTSKDAYYLACILDYQLDYDCYWDDVVVDHLSEFNLTAIEVQNVIEVDTNKELEAANEKY